VNFSVPAKACDCHTHLFGDPSRYPFATPRNYTPEPASVDEMRALHRALHTQRVVLVQPAIYGANNSCIQEGLKQFGSSARGIAVIDDKTTNAELDDLERAGFRGIRLTLQGPLAEPAPARRNLSEAVDRLKNRKWQIQIVTTLGGVEALKELVASAPMPIVFDHFGGAKGPLGVDQPGFATLLNLVQSGKAYVKISGAYRGSNKAPDYPDMAPLAKALIAANPQHIVWGTDWPHPNPNALPGHPFTDITPLIQIDDGALLNQLPVWAPDANLRKTILVDNPAKLYGF
jgi:predicted TIM-barrel fold metal-dependent hydrolase